MLVVEDAGLVKIYGPSVIAGNSGEMVLDARCRRGDNVWLNKWMDQVDMWWPLFICLV